MSVEEVKNIEPVIELSDRQKLFCDEYTKDLNATQAAIRAGYSEDSARQIGSENLSKPYLASEIKRLLILKKLSKEETEKLVSDIAHSNISNYLKPVKRYIQPHISVTIPEAVKMLEQEIEDDEYYLAGSGIDAYDLEPEEIAAIEKQQKLRRREIARLNIEYQRNPTRLRMVPGPVKEVEEMELDLIKLAADKEKGKIKSWKMGKHGLEVELFSADAALRDLLKIHGSYAPEKSEVTGKDGIPLVDLTQLTDEQLKSLIAIQSQSGAGKA
jgi:phage terminase small subunit